MAQKILSEEVRHNLTRVVDRKFIRSIFCEHLPKYYPNYKKLVSFELDPYKRHISPRNVVFVVEFKIKYEAGEIKDYKNSKYNNYNSLINSKEMQEKVFFKEL